MAHIEYPLEALEIWKDNSEWAKKLYKEKKLYLDDLYSNLINHENILDLSSKNISGILDLREYNEFINYKKINSIDCSNNQITEIINIPFLIKYLNCSNNQIISLLNLPNNIKYLDLPLNYINPIDKLPNSIEYINFVDYDECHYHCGFHTTNLFDKPINNLPSSLVHLNITGSYDFNQSLNNLPNNLEILEIEKLLNYDKPINKLPNKLKKLIFKTHNNYILDNIINILPKNLR